MTQREAKYTLPFLLICNIVALALLVLSHGGCGPTTRQKTLDTSFTTVNALRAGYDTWHRAHLNNLADSAKTIPEGEAAIDAYLLQRAPVLELFEATYHAIALALSNENTPIIDIAGRVVKLAEAVKALQSAMDGPGAPADKSP